MYLTTRNDFCSYKAERNKATFILFELKLYTVIEKSNLAWPNTLNDLNHSNIWAFSLSFSDLMLPSFQIKGSDNCVM